MRSPVNVARSRSARGHERRPVASAERTTSTASGRSSRSAVVGSIVGQVDDPVTPDRADAGTAAVGIEDPGDERRSARVVGDDSVGVSGEVHALAFPLVSP